MTSEKGLNDHSNRDHALLSASSAHRWLACPPSAVAAEAYPQQDTEYTREGTLAHEVAETVASGDTPPETIETKSNAWIQTDVTQEMVDCATEYRDYIQEQIKSPTAVVLLEQRVDFSPWVPDGFGTADCIIIQGDTMDVIDYKYGKGVAVSAEDNPQEKLYGLGALNDYGFAYDIKNVRLHIFQPRLNNISVDELTTDELMAWGEEIKPTADKAAKGKGKYQPGEHCRFCPHAGRCRALTKVCTEFVETHGVKAVVEVLTPWEIAEVLRVEPLVSLWLKRVKAHAMAAMLDGDEVPGFKVVAGKLGNRKWTDEMAVAHALRTAGYKEEDYTTLSILSPAGMDKAIGKNKVAELLAPLIERAPGAPTIAPETDKRPKYDQAAETLKDLNS